MSDIFRLSASEIIAGYAARTLSPVDVLRDALERIERFEPAINAFTIVDPMGRWRRPAPPRRDG